MVKIKIDGKEVEVEEGTYILQAAEKLGIKIPTLCYHPSVEPYGACRLCSVEIEKNGRKIAILGDMLELGKDSKELHREIGVFVSKLNFNRFIGVGKMMKSATNAAITCGMDKNNVIWYETSAEAQVECANFKRDDLILLKGSRGIKMERVIDSL